MKLSFAAFACALGIATASPGKVRKLSPGIKVHNSVYAGKDFGMGCGRLGKKSVADSTKAPVIYCFEVVNTGNTRLNNVVLTNSELNGFFDNSIHHLEPGESKIVPFIHELMGDLVNNVVVSAIPVLPDGTPIENFGTIKATDSSEVIDVIARTRKLKGDSASKYASPVTGLNDCIQKQWEESGNAGELICATRDVVSLGAVAAQEKSKCVAGYTATVTIDASVIVAVNTLYDLGWYIDTAPQGDSMQGDTCIVNGLIEPNEYSVVNAKHPTVPFGDVKWGTNLGSADDDNTGFNNADLDDKLIAAGGQLSKKKNDDRKKKRKQRRLNPIPGNDNGDGDDAFSGNDDTVGGMDNGDGDECGDIYIHGEDEALIKMPIAVEVTLACEDANEDGNLDFPICFTWRLNGAAECTFGTNLPEKNTGGCFCTRVDLPNVHVIEVITPPVNDTAPC
jgi:hypothetical protein